MPVTLPLLPELNSGWCQYASVQAVGCAARSALSHCSCADPAVHATLEQFELSAIRCHVPTS